MAELGRLRQRGIDRRQPVLFRLIEAFERRASAHTGEARRVLDARLAALLETLSVDAPAPAVPAATGVVRGPLGQLVDVLAQRRPALTPVAGARPAADPATLQFFQRTWSRLSAGQRLAQSHAALPGNAGPLNSQHLVHRALMRMNELSPAYLQHFVAYVDALQWLEQAGEAAAAPARRGMPARR